MVNKKFQDPYEVLHDVVFAQEVEVRALVLLRENCVLCHVSHYFHVKLLISGRDFDNAGKSCDQF